MRIPGVKTVKTAARWLRSRFQSRCLILGYHQIADAETDPQGIRVTPKHFQAQMAVIRRHANVLSMEALVQGIVQNNLPGKAVAVTFDDGYMDVLENAAPVLEKYDVPATVFIITGYINKAYWWDVLEGILITLEMNPVPLPAEILEPLLGERAAADFRGGDPSRQLRKSFYDHLQQLGLQQREVFLDQLRSILPTDEFHNEGTRGMTAEEIQTLAESGRIDIGSHGVTHIPLESLSPDSQVVEMKQSKETLEAILGEAIGGFSYPHGSKTALSTTLLERSGYHYACASHNDVLMPGGSLYDIPRFWTPDWDGDRFGRWLQFWLTA